MLLFTWKKSFLTMKHERKQSIKKTHLIPSLFRLTFYLCNPPKIWVPQTHKHPAYYFYLYPVICSFNRKPFLRRSEFLSIKHEHLKVVPTLIFKRKSQVLPICSLNINWPFNSRKALLHNFWHLLKSWRQILLSLPQRSSCTFS